MLAAEGISKRWPGRPGPVLDDVDLTLSAGEVLWVGGDNGTGKTTLLRIVAGLIRPEAGRVSLLELDPEGDRVEFQRRVGFLSAGNTGLYARLSVREHLRFWASIAFVGKDLRRETIETTISRFGLEELAGRRADRLSLGQRQRVRLAMAFLHGPTLALLDEPRTSLDDDGAGLVAGALERLVAAEGCAIVCSPSRHEIPYPVTRGLVLSEGRLEPC